MQHIKTLLLVVVFSAVYSRLSAINPPPANDTVCNAIDLGILPVPGPCPTYPYGDTVVVSGSTDWATTNSFDFSPVSCFPSGSPDVWYKFRSTGSYIYIELFGSGDLDSMFCKLYTSTGSCVGLIPGHCETTFNGVIMASILTPDIGGEYYLQIGGSRYDETGNFNFVIKSFNDCSDCVKNANVTLDPAPWFGRYGTSDTVTMCYTVERWDQTTSSKLHSVIPLFGDEWDTTTLTPVSFPATGAGWIWGNNIPTPLGSYDGFYFDGNFNGDPTDNPGQAGNVTTSWEFCWSISTKTYCNAYDAHVQIHAFSDDQTGNGNSVATCTEAIPMYLSMAGWCCPDPIFSITQTGGCANIATVTVDPVSSNNGDTFNITIYNDTLGFYAYQGNVTTTALFTLPPGEYLFEVHNASINCPSFHVINIPGPFEIEMEQTVVGCGPNSGSVVATPVGGTTPYTFVWPNITTYQDSFAFSLSEGFVVVTITDGAGCTVTDSLYVNVLPGPSAYFEYPDQSRCHNDDTIQTTVDPYTAGGTWQLVSPLSSPITIDAVGTIHLNSATTPTPYWVVVKYTAGTACTDSYIDSIQIVQRPADPVATTPLAVDWCIGSGLPTLSVALTGAIPSWYGLQTTQVGLGLSFTPTLPTSTAPGQYHYVITNFADLTFYCASANFLTFTVTAIAPPQFTVTPGVTICPDDTVAFAALGSITYNYNWQPVPNVGAQNAMATSASPSGTTNYTVTVADGPCISTGFVLITVDSAATCGETLFNGITPNGDGLNDTWIIESAYSSTNMTVSIYNRWGNQVWRGNNYNNTTVIFTGRNGKGEDLPSGTYFYTIEQDYREAVTGWLELSR